MSEKELKFEDAIARLETIVQTLEGGKCDLDESLGLFEEGVSLVKFCSARLDEASEKVRVLTVGKDGAEDE